MSLFSFSLQFASLQLYTTIYRYRHRENCIQDRHSIFFHLHHHLFYHSFNHALNVSLYSFLNVDYLNWIYIYQKSKSSWTTDRSRCSTPMRSGSDWSSCCLASSSADRCTASIFFTILSFWMNASKRRKCYHRTGCEESEEFAAQ